MAKKKDEEPVKEASAAAREQAILRMRQAMQEVQLGTTKETAAEVSYDPEDKDPKLNRKLVAQLKKNTHTVLKSVKVYSPFRTYYEGQATSVSAVNRTGPFDILPAHKNFLTLLTPCDVVIRNDRGVEKIKIDRGIMHVREDHVVVFLDV